MRSNRLPIWGANAGCVLKLDCTHYRGDRPCDAGVDGVCPTECESYTAMGHRILIIKLGALGDVIRTTCLLEGIKRRWPQSHVTWVTKPSGVRMLAGNPLIDRLVPFDASTLCHIEVERFDLCLSLDKEPAPAGLAMRVDAPDRRGIGLSTHGTVFPLNETCAEYFELGLSDALKFHANQKSYQQMIYEAVGLEYHGERYRLHPSSADWAAAALRYRALGIGPEDIVVGLNTGAGDAFANKTLSVEQFIALAGRIHRETAWRVALFGGPGEQPIHQAIVDRLPRIVDTGCDHDELTFAAMIDRAAVIVTGDTMAMHVAIARDVPCVAVFGPTCAQEIDLFERGEKILTPIGCSPCYRRSCDESPNCMDQIERDRVFEAVRRQVGVPGSIPLPTESSCEPLA